MDLKKLNKQNKQEFLKAIAQYFDKKINENYSPNPLQLVHLRKIKKN